MPVWGRNIPHGTACKLPTQDVPLRFGAKGADAIFSFYPVQPPLDLPKQVIKSVHPTLAGYISTFGIFSVSCILGVHLSSLRALEHLFLFTL